MVRRSIGAIAFAGLLVTFTLAQEPHTSSPSTQIPPTIKISFPRGISFENIWLEYGLYGPTGDGRNYNGLTGSKSISQLDWGQGHIVVPDHSYEIVALRDGRPVNRFKALAWTRGCQVVTFDSVVAATDVVLRFSCVPLKRIPLAGRIQQVDFIGNPSSLRVGYLPSTLDRFFCDSLDPPCRIEGPPLQILEVATATIAFDGSFKVNVPDFAEDPFFSGDSNAEFELTLTSSYMRVGPEAENLRSEENGLKMASSYPSEIAFVPFHLGSKIPSGTPAR